jgi:eukaryotic translation initiation factor 2C
MSFFKSFVSSCMTYGFKEVPQGPPAWRKADIHQSVENNVEVLASKICSTQNATKPGLIFVLLHQESPPSVYKSVKGVCELSGIPSQAMLVEKSVWSQKGQLQYIANVILKVNAKLGGFNHSVAEEKLFSRPIMMIGADISHPSPKELREVAPPPSYAAVVGSYDRSCARYSAVTKAMSTAEHIITGLEPVLTELLKRFHDRVGRFPERIIYWRDGLAESQVASFKSDELSAFKGKCNSIFPLSCI